jgi:hypothetical protein
MPAALDSETRVTLAQKVFFAAVGLLAIWVGVWGYFAPARVDTAIPWLVPPLHARFLGAMYLSGATYMLGALLARAYAEVWVVVRVIALWTGMLFLVSLLHLGAFDYSLTQVWVWFAAYIAYPLIALWMMTRDRGWRATGGHAPPLPRLTRRYLLAQGVFVTALALALLIAPGAMAVVWPWAITTMLAQIYAAPFLAYGVSSLLLARAHTWRECRIALTAMFVFALGVLLASVLHRALFTFASPSAWLWFGGFALAAGVLGALVIGEMRARRAEAQA